jgi:hypothetical protein
MVNWALGDLFLKDYGHQGSIEKLWKERWQFPVRPICLIPCVRLKANQGIYTLVQARSISIPRWQIRGL